MSGITQGLMASIGANTSLQYVGGRSQTVAASATPSYSITSLTGGLASAPAAGDLVIACVAFSNSTDRNITCSTAGYTEIADLVQSDTNYTQLGVYYKLLTTAETSVAFNIVAAVDSVCAVHVWRNSNSVTPLDATTTTATAGNSGVPNPPSITTVTANAVVVAIGAAADDPGGITTFTAPSGMSNLSTIKISQDLAIGVASIARASAGAYDPAVFGGGSVSGTASWCAATVAIRPA